MEAITLKYEVEPEDECLYPGGLTNIRATAFNEGRKIGTIGGVSVDRQRIGANSFHAAFDEHSGDLEWVGCALLENRQGRTKLKSLLDGGDDPEFNFFLVDTFCIDADQSSDVATFALRKFLHGEHIRGNLDCDVWWASSVAYVLNRSVSSSINAAHEVQQQGKMKRGDDDNVATTKNYHEVIPFLRNGFFQDAALILSDPDNERMAARILIGAMEHLDKRLLSESEERGKADLLRTGKSEKKLKGSDSEILKLVNDLVNEAEAKQYRSAMMGASSAMMGASSAMLGTIRYQSPEDGVSDEQLKELRSEILRLQSSGGSVARSGALHAACEKNAVEVVGLLLQIDATGVTVKDRLERTPLIVAAINAAGRLSINGIDDTSAIDALLSVGASKSDVDSSDMTAYGHFKCKSNRYLEITHYEHRHKLTDLEHKLYPPGGPTRGDFSEGKGGSSGLVDYGPESDDDDDCDY